MVFPKRNRNQKRRTGSNRAEGVGVLDGGGAVRRQPRHQYQTRVRFLRQLNVMSQRLVATITGNVDTIDSPRGDYTSFFMETERGPTMVVSHAGSPDRESGDELVGDLQQIYGYGADGAAPSALIMHVDAGEEAGAREAAQAIVDRLNAERGEADQLVLREDGIENTSGGTRSLNFRVERAGGGPPVGAGGPARRGQPVEDGQLLDVEQVPSDDVQPALLGDDGPPPADGDDPLPGALPADPPDDPDASLRIDDTPLPSVEAFRAATRERSLRGRTAEYERLVAALATYHREVQRELDDGPSADVADYVRSAQALKDEMTTLGAEKTRQIAVLTNARTNIPRLQSSLPLINTLRDEAQAKLTSGDVLDEPTRTRLQQTVDQQTTQAAQTQAEIARLQQQLPDATAEIQRLDGRLLDATTRNKQLIRQFEVRVRGSDTAASRARADLATAAKGYLDSKKHSATDTKQIAVRGLLRNATDPNQHLQPLKAAASELWGTEFRHQLDRPPRLLNTGTASDVFRVETVGEIGTSGKRVGFAKRTLVQGDLANDTTVILDIPDDPQPNGTSFLRANPKLIARQVASSRIARELELDLIAEEVFSADLDGRVIGVTAEAPGRGAMEKETLPDGSEREVFLAINLRDPRIQRNLSNLQVLDALTGQKDRHLGNIFIDTETGRVTGIDNDMAFARSNPERNLGQNELQSFVMEDGELKFTLDQIDRDLAARIMEPAFEGALLDLLRGREGDPERLAEGLGRLDGLTNEERADALDQFPEVAQTLNRLTAIRNRITELQRAGQLIGGRRRPWGEATYNHGLTRVTGVGDFAKPLNYLARAHLGFEAAGNPNDQTKRQAGQGG